MEFWEPTVIIVSSVTYFRNSKFYTNNTAAILLKADQKTSKQNTWACFSKNATNHTLISLTSPRSAHVPVQLCKLHTFVATCSTVENPIHFSLGLPNYDVNIFSEIPIRYPIKERLPVVSCVSSLYFAERFQQIVLSIEAYAYFGVNRQAYYLLSALEGVYNLLQEYEKARLIDLHNWWLPDVDEFPAKLQLSTRDQVGALNDCFINYREAADFIIVHDVDDLIFLSSGGDFHFEFSQLWKSRPQTAYFQYPSFAAIGQIGKNFHDFDMARTLNSLVIGDFPWDGKSVYNTSLVETVWIHWTDFYKENLSGYKMPPNEGIVVHARHWSFDQEKSKTALMEETYNSPHKQNRITKVNSYYPKISSLLSSEAISQINLNYEMRMLSIGSNKTFSSSLTSNDLYYKLADACVSQIGGFTYRKIGCRTNYACTIPPFFGVTCVQTKQYLQKTIFNEYFIVYAPAGKTRTVFNHNGCNVF